MQKSNLVKLLLVSVLFFLRIDANYTQLVINEGSNKNYQNLADEDDEFPDWIELLNAGTDTINLYNYGLTDDLSEPYKWTFPNVKIAPGEFKPVFCSGKDRKPISGFTQVLTSYNYNPTNGWNTHTFTTPFEWDGVSNVLINVCSYDGAGYTINSVFNQTATPFQSCSFTVQDGSAAACSNTNGSVASQRPNLRINGQQIGSGTIQNGATDYPAPYGNWYWGARHQILILASELNAAGVSAGTINSLAFDVASTDPAMNYDYVEFYMKQVSYSSLSGIMESLNPLAYQHTNFTINRDGEMIHLFAPGFNEISNLYVNCPIVGSSQGRKPDVNGTIFYFRFPTPVATNNAASGVSDYLQPPVFSVPSGMYTSNFSITLSNPNGPGTYIYYTLDGSEPTSTSLLFNGNPINVNSTRIIKAKAFGSNVLPSVTVGASYLMNVDHSTPVISLITPNSNLYGPNGIFDNWWEDWQRFSHVDYFSENNQLVFSQQSGMQVDGGWGGSRSHPQHSFRLEFDHSVLGQGSVGGQFIPNRPNRQTFSNFYLRNGSNQFLVFPYKDAVQEECMSGTTKNYYSAWRPISVYINGQYFGLYELREKFDDEYFLTLEGAHPDSVDILSLSAWQNFVLRSVEGAPADTFYANYNAFNNLNPLDTNYWEEADHYFDLAHYTDYIIAESWMGNVDWPGNNIKIVRTNTSDFRYRFCTIDMELAMAPNGWTDCFADHIGYMLGQSSDNPFINVWLQSLQNNRFKDYFINRYADVMNTEYLTSRILPIEQAFYDLTVPEMDNEYQRWGDPNNIPQQMSDFNNNHLVFRDQLAQRTDVVRGNMEYHFGLPNQVDLTLDVHPSGAGKIHISTIEPTVYPWDGIYFNGVPVKIEAIPNPGFVFSHWGSNSLISNVLSSVFLDTLDVNSIQFDAYFQAGTNGISELTQELFHVYPNPAENEVYILNESNGLYSDLTYEVQDQLGRIVSSGAISDNVQVSTIDFSDFTKAVYYVNVKSDNKLLINFKVIKL
jgi:hypothetical protein